MRTIKVSRTITRTVLDNGVRVLSSYYPVRTIGVGFGLDHGSVLDPKKYPGLRHCAEHFLLKGAPGYPFRRAARLLERHGIVNAATDRFQIIAPYVMPAAGRFQKYFGQSFGVLAKLFALPTFNETDFRLEQEVILREIETYDADPAEHAMNYLAQTLFGPDHPLAKSILGDKKTVLGLGRDEMTAFCQNLFDPNRLVVLSHGCLRHSSLIRQVEAFFSRYERHIRKNPIPSPPASLFSRPEDYEEIKRLLGKRGRNTELHPDPLYLPQLPEELGGVAVGCVAPHVSHEMRYAIEVIRYLLGGSLIERHSYMSGDLFYALREQHGLIYSVYEIAYSASPWSGFFYFSFKPNPKDVSRAGEIALDIFRRYRREGIPRHRLEDIRYLVDSHHQILRENEDSQILSWMLDSEFCGIPGELDEYVERIKAVTHRQVMDALEEYFDPDRTLVCTLVYPNSSEDASGTSAKVTSG